MAISNAFMDAGVALKRNAVVHANMQFAVDHLTAARSTIGSLDSFDHTAVTGANLRLAAGLADIGRALDEMDVLGRTKLENGKPALIFNETSQRQARWGQRHLETRSSITQSPIERLQEFVSGEPPSTEQWLAARSVVVDQINESVGSLRIALQASERSFEKQSSHARVTARASSGTGAATSSPSSHSLPSRDPFTGEDWTAIGGRSDGPRDAFTGESRPHLIGDDVHGRSSGSYDEFTGESYGGSVLF